MTQTTRMLVRAALAPLALAAAALWPANANAEIIELVDGSILQGKVLPGRTTDDGLGLYLFETGGEITVDWRHILESRRKSLRLQYGIDVPEETEIKIPGHSILLTNGDTVVGVAENPRALGEPLRLRTRTGVRPYDRRVIAKPPMDVQIDALLVYSPEELYTMRRDEAPPENAAAHKALAEYAIAVGALEHAKEHLLVAKGDAQFMETVDGRTVEPLIRRVELLLRAKGASDLVQQIKIARTGNTAAKWNEAKRLFEQLGTDYPDDQIRKAVGYDSLGVTVQKGRDKFFQRAVAEQMYRHMQREIMDKAMERKSKSPTTNVDRPRGVAEPGTLQAAMQWAGKQLQTTLLEKVSASLDDLSRDDVDAYWKARTANKNLKSRTASYGSGSFIVIKKAPATPGTPRETNRPRRPPGAGSRGNQPAPQQQKAEKPKTNEEWWEERSGPERAKWLTAHVVETSGLFEILRADDAELCRACGGNGYLTSSGTDGTESRSICVQCNTAGKIRNVVYR